MSVVSLDNRNLKAPSKTFKILIFRVKIVIFAMKFCEFGYPRVFVACSVRVRVLPEVKKCVRVASGNTFFGSGFRVIGYPTSPY